MDAREERAAVPTPSHEGANQWGVHSSTCLNTLDLSLGDLFKVKQSLGPSRELNCGLESHQASLPHGWKLKPDKFIREIRGKLLTVSN